MLSREVAYEMIEQSVAELNEGRTAAERIPFSDALVLFGAGSPLDSLDFVNLVAMLEERVEATTGKVVSLTDSMFESQDSLPFASPTALADYLTNRVGTART